MFVVVATTKVGIFKQITTRRMQRTFAPAVVVATTKVGIFKQITTQRNVGIQKQRCCCYHKGRNFQANHNTKSTGYVEVTVVVATTKVGIFKQITT